MEIRDLCIKETVQVLRKKVRTEQDANVRDRIRVLLYAARGFSNISVADRLGYSNVWVQKWFARYKQEGLAGLQDAPRSGQPRFLTEEQTSLLYREILAGPDPEEELRRKILLEGKM